MTAQKKNPNFQPLYAQVKALMIDRLMNNDWTAGMVLPSESQLAAEFQVSQGTVRKALDEMTAEHLLVRRQGRGTFVAEHTQQRALFHFLHLVDEDDNRQLPQSQVISIETCQACDQEVQQLELENGASVIRIKRIRNLNEQAVICETISVPYVLFPTLGQQDGEIPNSLYSLYERQYGISVNRATERISAESAAGEIAERLGLTPGTPLLRIQRTAYSLNARPVELRISHCHTEHHHYLSQLT
ncbi:GntR family transcriptional regulator [Amphritea sp. 1_MG-2023]|uniref:GntR family transcriptional regulator n=1 Tax=Amphritea sp. 1_MG-2023 TaxID=3062670 RepID=UPI0026E22726|nr:GntR family transcriptional regulator [Amphritea sp. 1_MG-2023]MDO6565155.1 GntR family transcriptional regulator [Amphritea sp. 1_MG-2023]